MSKYCPIAKEYTNCTDNCHYCLQEEEADAVNNALIYGEMYALTHEEPTEKDELLEDLHLEQLEQM